MINFNKAPCIYWCESVKISHLQRRIIMHSLLYYESNVNCISDESSDELCIQLLEMQKSADMKEFKGSTYYHVFYDSDGSTGCDIPQRLTDYDYRCLLNIAQHVYRLYEQGIQNKRIRRRRLNKNVDIERIRE